MRNYREVFPKRHTLLAVIHVADEHQVLRNLRVAQQSGADGAFLINHKSGPLELLRIYERVRPKLRSYWIGLNLLGLSPLQALFRLPAEVSGLWVDNAGVKVSGRSRDAEEVVFYRERSQKWSGLYFGGVAFKYQEEVEDPALAAAAAMPYVDVITTSGVGTGFAPDPGKIQAMKLAVGEYPLAIASGITPENVHHYKEADCFLVATGISSSEITLDPKRVEALAKALQ